MRGCSTGQWENGKEKVSLEKGKQAMRGCEKGTVVLLV